MCFTTVWSFISIALTVVNLQSGHELALQMIKGKKLKNFQSRVMVLVHDTSSYCALQVYEVHLNSFNGCPLTERTRNSIANDQREITPKIFKAELWLLCMAHCLIVLYKCMKFYLRRYAANDKIFKLFFLHPFLASTIYNNTIKNKFDIG